MKGELDSKLKAALEGTESTWLKLQKAQAKLQTLGDANLMLNDSKLQIHKIKVDVVHFAEALR